MTTLYKMTDADGRSYGSCQWGEGVQHVTSGEGDLCGPGWTHWYESPLVAEMMNPIHGDYCDATALLWEGEGTIEIRAGDLKCGCADGRTLRRIERRRLTTEDRIAVAIVRCAVMGCDPAWKRWARNWLSGADRTQAAAGVELAAAALAEAAWAARAAAWAALAATWASAAAWASEAARVAAVEAARAARGADVQLHDLIAWVLAHRGEWHLHPSILEVEPCGTK